MISIRLYVFLFISTLICGCSTGTFLRPTASNGEFVKANQACPRPNGVIQFTPKNKDWVHFRVYALLPRQTGSGTQLNIEVQTQVGLGLPRSEWKGEEFKRRAQHRFLFSASKPEVVLVRANGSKTTIYVQLFWGERNLESNTILLVSDKIILSQEELTNFTIEFPTIFIDGESMDIPQIHFAPDQELEAPVLNC
jgi:hypothetical protein